MLKFLNLPIEQEKEEVRKMSLDQLVLNEFINIEFFIFVVFPYIAILTCIVGSIWRYRHNQYTYSALSSQFFGSDLLVGWGLRLWHYGIFLILFGHFMALVFTEPYAVLKHAIEGIHPIFQVLLDGMRIGAGLAALIGLLLLIIRRMTNDYVRQVTSKMDVIILTLLLVQIILGFTVLITHYGIQSETFWFADQVAPWFQGVLLLKPEVPQGIEFYAAIHMLLPFLIVALIPFSRLVHMFTFPISYLIRPYQLVIWHRNRQKRLTTNKQ